MEQDTAMGQLVDVSTLGMPYVGLVPFDESQSRYFFGRDADRNRLVANLLGNRLTLVYGPSGVGKSSVLRAGVVHSLRQQATQNLKRLGTPKYVVVSFGTWRETPLLALRRTIQETIQAACALEVPPPNTHDDFIEQCREWSTTYRISLLLILDQFEEYFLYHPTDSDADAGTIAGQLARLLNTPDLRVNVMLSLRDDALAKLDRFKGVIPALLDNRLRIEHLTRAAATDAIRKPLAQFNADNGTAYDIEAACIEQILNEVARGRVSLSSKGSGNTTITAADADRIETPYLQLVLTTLWEKEQMAGSILLRRATLDALGGAERIVRNHLNNTMATLDATTQNIAAQFFDRLVTTGGTKIALSLDELSSYAEADAAQVEKVLQALQGARLVRTVQSPGGVTQYEIYHDVLARAVVEWQNDYHQKEVEAEAAAEMERIRREREKEQQQTNRLRLLLGLVAVVALVAIGLAVWANTLRVEANNQTKYAQALLFHNEGVRQFETAPIVGLRLLAEGFATSDNAAVQTQLRASLLDALATGRVQRWDDENRTVTEVIPVADDNRFVRVSYNNGPGDIWDITTGKRVVALPERVLESDFGTIQGQPHAEFSLADGTGKVWNLATGAEFTILSKNLAYVVFSHDELQRYALANYEDGPSDMLDLETGEVVVALDRYALSVSFTRVAAQVYGVIEYDSGPGEVWNLTTGKRIAELSDVIESVAFSGNDASPYMFIRYVAAPPEIRNVVTGELIGDLPDRMNNVIFSGSAGMLYGVIDYQQVSDVLWNFTTGTIIATLPNDVSTIDFSGTATYPYVIITYFSSPSELWNLETGKPIATLTGVVNGIYFSGSESQPNAVIVHVAMNSPAEIWNLATDDQRVPLVNSVRSVAFSGSESQTYAVIIYQNLPSELWNMATGEPVVTFEEEAAFVRVSENDTYPYALIGFYGRPAELWNLTTGTHVATLPKVVDVANFYTVPSDSAAPVLLLTRFQDGQSSLYQIDSDTIAPLVDLGLGIVSDYTFPAMTDDPAAPPFLVATYSDGRAYRVDLSRSTELSALRDAPPNEVQAWLCAYIQSTSEAAGVSLAELDIALQPYLQKGTQPQSCR